MSSPLVTPPGVVLSPENVALVACFSVTDLSVLHRIVNRSYTTQTWRKHPSKLISMTAKGAGGTGKTTAAWNASAELLMDGKEDQVLVTNLDSQPSLEERLLGKVIHNVFNDDFNSLLALNNLTGSTILSGLNSCLAGPEFRLEPPKLLTVDPVRLAGLRPATRAGPTRPTAGPFFDPGDSGKRIHIMLSDENISEWDHQLSTSSVLRNIGAAGSIHKAVPGALYSLLQMTAYVLGVTYIVMDMGPGNGGLNRIAIMCSDAWFMPLCIDNKCASTIASFASSLPTWATNYVQTVWQTAGTDNKYPLPVVHVADAAPTTAAPEAPAAAAASLGIGLHLLPSIMAPPPPPTPRLPKFLGVVFSRLGVRGAVRPYNQYAALLRSQQLITQALIPSVVACNMALPMPAYQQCLQPILNTFAQMPAGAQAAPNPVPGVCNILREFDSLQYMSERESVPVPFLQQHHFLSPGGDEYGQFLEALAANPNLPYPPDDAFLALPTTASAVILSAKVANIRGMTRIFLRMITDNL
ncbi:hypothetical protein CEUSTIGMA_g7505.t1 [Chlamydomonas eustigma]|uniref:Uncharacterized protein n=1 Tax=Chlamydomonas eustigma TaxID=1157962 RepID=A0A250XAG5_9CHLO|nr:hypothetical protein CEUSTIGMA_g7505.t1 [Chlamydomonas eustigma]|eukprot:GAX80067.1 hypothetical protein CEUSTIGMA_g7505.t1 [Chlamydomonas eustigma]